MRDITSASWKCNFPAPCQEIMNDRSTDRPTDRPGHREVTRLLQTVPLSLPLRQMINVTADLAINSYYYGQLY